MEDIRSEIIGLLSRVGVDGDIILSSPPKPELGDFAFACFGVAKTRKQNPAEAAEALADEIFKIHKTSHKKKPSSIERVQAVGPYINFWLDPVVVAQMVLRGLRGEADRYGTHTIGRGKKVLVEYGCPNPLKVFHLGHLRNLISGESVARILGNAGYDVVRVNYQGDVGMHVAKALWAIESQKSKVKSLKSEPLDKRIAFLGMAYAQGAQAYETDPTAKAAIEEINKKVYERDASILELYTTTRQWSLDYFATIYDMLGTRYDHLYFESEMVGRGLELVKEFLAKDVFAESQGAVIFPGSKFGLHDRVFVNSLGYPTYEAKELALAERHRVDYQPERVIHVVGKEQTEYFKVIFAALEKMWPETKGREQHLVGGYLQLKGDKKMSSRTGTVVTGDELLARVERRVQEIMAEADVPRTVDTGRAVAVAALKYAMLKSGVSDDIAFDLEQSVSTMGDSGPYLLYIVARINSIIKKAEKQKSKKTIVVPNDIQPPEKQLLLRLAEYPEITKLAADTSNPSHIAQYLFRLAQAFNSFYESCPVMQAEALSRLFRLDLIQAVAAVMGSGLALLGIETVPEM